MQATGARRAARAVDLSGLAPFLATDIAAALDLTLLVPLAWLLPERAWPAAAAVIRVLDHPLKRRWHKRRVVRARLALSQRRGLPPAEAICRGVSTNQIVRQLQALRALRPGGWHPRLELAGLERLTAALEHGRGAILWVGFFADANLMAKVALHRAGLPLCHLSSLTHGVSRSRFGVRWLNPIPAAAENRYLAERVSIARAGPTSALRTLRRRLGENRPVSIVAIFNRTLNPVRAPFLDGAIAMGSGALDLGYAANAPVLPLFAVRDGPSRHRVVIEPALPMPRHLGRREARDQAFAAYVKLLESYVLRYPDQWLGWGQLPLH
jgi:hypothetical protein